LVGWLDQSEEQQRRMREVISLFAQSGTVDDIGIGVVRDAFSDLLFPGLSTVQTRIRYFLFVPSVYERLENQRVPTSRAAKKTRQQEVELISSLRVGRSETGALRRLGPRRCIHSRKHRRARSRRLNQRAAHRSQQGPVVAKI
jgi:hypothetical protein